MQHPCSQKAPQVIFGQGHHKVQAFLPQRADEPLAEGICLGALRWRFQDPQSQVPYALIKLLGENAVAVMEQKTVGMVSGNSFAQLLQGP